MPAVKPSTTLPRGNSRGRSSSPSLALWLGLALLVVLLDQLTKTMITRQFGLGDSLRITSFFNLVLAYNPGAAFSFLADAAGWQRWFFVGLGALASGFIIWMLRKHPDQRLFCLSISLIMGGAIGNVIDRLLHGHVIDFLQFRFAVLSPLFAGGYFPSFNVADAAISAGAIGLIFDEIRRVRRSR